MKRLVLPIVLAISLAGAILIASPNSEDPVAAAEANLLRQLKRINEECYAFRGGDWNVNLIKAERHAAYVHHFVWGAEVAIYALQRIDDPVKRKEARQRVALWCREFAKHAKGNADTVMAIREEERDGFIRADMEDLAVQLRGVPDLLRPFLDEIDPPPPPKPAPAKKVVANPNDKEA